MNDNCLGELHLLADTSCKCYAVMIYYADTLYKCIILSNLKDLWLTIIENYHTNKKSRQLKVIVICTCKDQFRLRSNTGMDPGPRSPNNEFVECRKKS